MKSLFGFTTLWLLFVTIFAKGITAVDMEEKAINTKENDGFACKRTDFSDETNVLKRRYKPSCDYNYPSFCVPPNCAEAMKDSKQTNKSGVYKIQPPNNAREIFVYCVEDPDEKSRPWLVIQRRRNGLAKFKKNWNDYKNGFGNLENEFFLGLENLHVITTRTEHELLIQLKEFKADTIHSAKYEHFLIGSEKEGYILLGLGKFIKIGNLDDGFTHQAGMKFSAPDKDNDLHYGSCAQSFEGGWWFRACFKSNLNGPYKTEKEANATEYAGIIWEPLSTHSLQYVQMAIRPVLQK